MKELGRLRAINIAPLGKGLQGYMAIARVPVVRWRQLTLDHKTRLSVSLPRCVVRVHTMENGVYYNPRPASLS